MTCRPLTTPERSTERALARRQLAAVYRAGGCGACKHAIHGWGRAACDTLGRTFPRCLSTPGKQFDLDENKLKGETPCTSES